MSSEHPSCAEPVFVEFKGEREEAHWICQKVKSLLRLHPLLGPSDFAILLRTRRQSYEVEQALRRHKISYRTVGLRKFFDRQEVRDILAYLQMVDHNSDLGLRRIINVPPRGIGDKTVQSLEKYSELSGVYFGDILMDISGNSHAESFISKKATTELKQLQMHISNMRNTLMDGGHLAELIDYICDKIGYRSFIMKTAEAEDRLANIEQLRETLETFEEGGVSEKLLDNGDDETEIPQTRIAQALASFALDSNSELLEQSDVDTITISTIHAAKGLEWPVVFIPRMNKGSIPHARAEDPDEERRLLFVAITRAKALLYLTAVNNYDDSEEISEFITPLQNIGYFQRCSPSITTDLVQTIAQILRRSFDESLL